MNNQTRKAIQAVADEIGSSYLRVSRAYNLGNADITKRVKRILPTIKQDDMPTPHIRNSNPMVKDVADNKEDKATSGIQLKAKRITTRRKQISKKDS